MQPATIYAAPNAATIVNTGFKIEIPTGYGLLLCGRSKLASQGYTVEEGVIDSDYRGEVKVILYNHTRHTKVIQKSERIAQGWFLPTPSIEFVEVDTLTSTK